jgi:hypothetical protein
MVILSDDDVDDIDGDDGYSMMMMIIIWSDALIKYNVLHIFIL